MRDACPHPHPPIPPGGLSWGAFVRVACVTQRPLGHAWLGHPGAPGHVCRGQPWGPSSRSAARAPPPGGLPAAAGGATASLSPPPCHSPLQRRAGSRAAPRSRPHQTRPLRPCPLLAVTHGWAAAAPPDPPPPERQPPSTARSPRSPRTPTPPRPPAVAPRCAGGLGGPRGAGHAPSTFSRNARPMPQHPPDTPRGSFLGGLCQGCLCHPAAPWSRLAGSPRSPGSRLPGSALGPFVTLRCPRPAPRGLACRGRGRDRLSVPAPLSFSPPTACRLPRRPPLPPPPDTPPAPLSPPRGHAWLGGRSAPRPPRP